jgi:formylglycine-generating enzyme required for sulfatase activity
MVERMRPSLSPLEEEFIRPESERLLKEIDNASTTHQKRVKIGDRLAEIGDPRAGVGLRADGLPDISWCEVPAGEITLEKIDKTFTVDPFYIGKYPVTWIQYRSFLEAQDGYRDKRWWEGLAERKSEPGEQYRKLDNHPSERVSWYDAVAFCHWLTKRLGYEIRLPTEWEWQQAATGGDPANEYPWGASWDSDRANTIECGLSRTTAVGLYPQGASPVGALDMSGNVREWCLNEYENPKRVEPEGEKNRSVRGGSWFGALGNARCAYRVNYGPDDRSSGVGFRLCCASPIF